MFSFPAINPGRSRLRIARAFGATLATVVFAGCTGTAIKSETQAHDRLDAVGEVYRPDGKRPPLPTLTENSSLDEYVRFALLNHPAVESAWQDWRARVYAITPARSLPDPRITFQADITDELKSLMPGLMFDLMTRGKREAMGNEAAEASEVARRKFITQVQETATQVRKAWVDLTYANEAVHLHSAMLTAFDEAAESAAADYVTGRDMATLETQVRLRNEAGMHHTQHYATMDLVAAARVRLKASLGLSPDQSDPPWPDVRLAPTAIPDEDTLWQRASLANPDIAIMHAMVDEAVAGVEVAKRAKTPDFSLGAMVDLKANPLMIRPIGGISLPIWKDKISAAIEAARARHDAEVARISTRQLEIAAELANEVFIVRQADEIITYIDDVALPNLDTVSSTAVAGYQSGISGATSIAETRALKLDMQVKRLDALRQRENAVADILMLVSGAAPMDTPLISAANP